jgi:hypothetical protein
MDEDDALALLRTRVPVSISSETDERALLQALEYIPLAIAQAGAHIANRAAQITVSIYLKHFRQSESNQEHLLNYEDAEDLRRDHTGRYAVMTTWQISFEQIYKATPAATDLLALMSMFDRQGIPEYLLHHNNDHLKFEDALALLVSFSLIRPEIGGPEVGERSFEMHRLVQLSIRGWLNLHGQSEKWKKESRNIIARYFQVEILRPGQLVKCSFHTPKRL